MQVSTEVYSIIVDYSRSLAEMIAAGRYCLVSEHFNDHNFPITGTGRYEVPVTVLHFDQTFLSVRTVITEMGKEGFKPAKIEKLLALGEAYPDLQRKFRRIVALGSVWHEDELDLWVPELEGGGNYRDLSLGWFRRTWNPDYRFLAVRV